MKYIKLSLILIALSLIQCTAPSSNEKEVLLEAPKPQSLLSNAAWILGAWMYEKEDKAIRESWTKVSEELYEGKDEFIFNKEVVQFEQLELRQEKGQIYYCVGAPDQAEGKTMKFLLTEMDERTLIFEKNDHDFPKRIHYTKMSDDEIVMELSGEIDGKEAGQIYIFKRNTY